MITVTFSRYATLFLYGFITYFIFSIFSSVTSIQTLWLGWSNLLQKTLISSNLANFHSYAVFLFLGGLTVNKIAENFSVYDQARYWQFNWRYPSLMLSVICSISIWLVHDLMSNYRVLSYELMLTYFPLLLGLICMPFLAFVQNLLKNLRQSSDEHVPQLHSSTKDISDEIASALNNKLGKSIRIAVCGPFGVGKTTAINSAIETIKSKKERPKLVHCNVELWGVETESIIQYVLDEVLIALGKEIDMCKFRSLPSHYISAMNAGNTSSKVIAAFIHKPTSPDVILKSISNVINAANLRLLVTIQDLDRNKEASASLVALADLLDRLEEFKGIDYIFAGENTPQFSDTLLRICPRRLDFPIPNFTDDVINLVGELIDQDLKKYYQDVLLDYKPKECPAELVNKLLPSYRDFQTLKHQIESSWENIKGEVLLSDFILIQALKNNQPKLYDVLYQMLNGDILKKEKEIRFNAFIDRYFPNSNLPMETIVKDTLEHFNFIELFGIPDDQNETLGRVISLQNIDNHLFSLNNERIQSILFSGFINGKEPKQVMVYEIISQVVQGNESALGTLCNGFEDEGNRQFWIGSLNSYGWAILHNQIEGVNTAKSLVHRAISLDSKEGSRCLLDNLKIRENLSNNPNSGLRSYLFSEAAVEDLFSLRSNFKFDTFFKIFSVYFSYNNAEPAPVEKYLNLIVKRFINSDRQGHLNLLIFCTFKPEETAFLLEKNTLYLLLNTLKDIELGDDRYRHDYERLMMINQNNIREDIDISFRTSKQKAISFVESIMRTNELN
ncbi:P-loop NTPase fold protein [Catenovulum adriaticum]|uniref:KAP family NTPase n=1 Tax=Catenovulum adriaticum TaxID=2984846 RepID=A0ABY7ARP3_9ALTE|nr:P-loop NTPase fold protein [Catenovulum sp. TS8]WAJ71985.1 KAP family NTPase [Catenovulum sp. TS8]